MAANNLDLTERNAFLALPPPRHVPPVVIRAAAPLGEMLGYMLLGIFIMLFGLAICWFFFPMNVLSQRKLNSEAALTAPGKILSTESTKTRINKRTVIKYQFSYQPDSGAPREGTAYTTGHRWSKDAAITVHYLPEDPAIAVPKGARLDVTGYGGLFVLIIPLAGMVFIFVAIYNRRTKLRILRYGRITAVTVDSIEKTNMRINSRRVFLIRMIRMDDHTVLTKRSHHPADIALAEAKILSLDPVAILYDPDKPQRFLFPETWNI